MYIRVHVCTSRTHLARVHHAVVGNGGLPGADDARLEAPVHAVDVRQCGVLIHRHTGPRAPFGRTLELAEVLPIPPIQAQHAQRRILHLAGRDKHG